MENSPLHPITEPFAIHHLNVGDGHTLYVEESGNPAGLPVLFNHGGPGAGIRPEHRGYFNPAIYRIILWDQRGCGQSTAADPLHANTTAHLLADMETIRTHLGISQWHTLAGWSWGSTLSLLYAQKHPEKLKSLVISGTFLADDATLAWSFGPHGAAKLHPQEYEAFVSLLGHPTEVIPALHAAFMGENKAFATKLARSWMFFDALTMEPAPDKTAIEAYFDGNEDKLLPEARLMLHYLNRRCFLSEGQIIANAAKLAHLPIWISHGTADYCCPITSSEKLKAALPHTTYTSVPGAGHRSSDDLKRQRINDLEAAARLP